MGWIFAFALFVVGLINGNDPLTFVASGVFAVAGAIANKTIK